MLLSEKEKLNVFRLCLSVGIITTNDIEKWAITTYQTSKITRIDYILDLCSAKSLGINEVVSILKRNENSDRKLEIKKMLYGIAGYLLRKKKISIEKAGRIIDLTAIEINHEIIFDNDLDFQIHDMICLASQGVYGNINEIINLILVSTYHYEKEAEFFLYENFKIQ